MSPLVGLLVVVIGALAAIGLFFALERWLRRPGLAFLLIGCSTVLAAGLGIADGKRLLPVLFLLQTAGFFFMAHWRWTAARSDSAGAGAPEA